MQNFIDSSYYEAWVNFGIAHRHAQDYSNAEYSDREALAIEPNYANLQIGLGVLNIARGETEKAIKLDKTIPVAFSNLSLAYAMDSQFEKAEISLQKAIALGCENLDIVRAEIEYLKNASSSWG